MTRPERVISIICFVALAAMPLIIGWIIGNAERAYVASIAAMCASEGGEPYRAIDSEDVVCLFGTGPLISIPGKR